MVGVCDRLFVLKPAGGASASFINHPVVSVDDIQRVGHLLIERYLQTSSFIENPYSAP